MKSLIVIILSIFSFSISSLAQTKPSKNQKASFEVSGVCEMCKARIEKAALIPGVKMATWDQETSALTVIYNDRKIDLFDIHTAIAKAGHDTEKIKSEDVAYKSLPACCAYRGGVEKH
ncbi:MAG: heavy-metal-associated domain-containing protein [Luteibaculum sp.]